MSREITVKEIMRDIVSVDAGTTVKDAARIMSEKEIGSLVVKKNGAPFGIVTKHILVERIVAEGADPSKIRVEEIMVAPLIKIDAGETLIDLARRMTEKQRKRLVVTDKEKIVGIVSLTDLVEVVASLQQLAKLDAQ